MRGHNTEIDILDCTIRDGGYLNNWDFDKNLVREVFRAVSKSGIDYFEIGFRGTEKYFNKDSFGRWRFSREEDIAEVCKGIEGSKIAVMADYGKIEHSDFVMKEMSLIDLVRIAAHKDKMREALDLLAKIRNKGYRTSIQAMGYSNYSKHDVGEFIRMLKDFDLDYTYIADSYGSIFPDQIKGMVQPLLELERGIKIGFHPHNSLQMAFANTIEAINSGVTVVDSSFYGMGRGSGNLPTEIILSYFQNYRPDKFNSLPVLDCIDRFFIEMQKDIGWGYQLPYMLSGLFECHPTYAKKIVDMREYSIDDIWRALNYIKKENPIGYSEEVFNNVLVRGIIAGPSENDKRSISNEQPGARSKGCELKVPYANKHAGKIFLVLGNGPSLKEYKAHINEFIDKFEPVVLGANNLDGMFEPHYHAFSNKRRFMQYVDTVSAKSKLLISQYIGDKIIKEYTEKIYEKICYIDTLNNDFGIIDGVIQCNCRTVSVLLMGVAIVMGAEKIFAVGFDGYIDNVESETLYYDEKESKSDENLIIDMHRWNKKIIEQINEYYVSLGKEGVHILTPTSYGLFYKGISNYI